MEQKNVTTTYLIPTRRCNLSCGHCDISKTWTCEDISEFMDSFRKLACKNCILFGGEPLLLKRDTFDEIVDSGKVSSISSNLLLLDSHVTRKLAENGISVATSWNYSRFRDGNELDAWFLNIVKLLENGIYVTILITLTEDLCFSAESKTIFFQVLDRISGIMDDERLMGNLRGVRFEPFVQSTHELIMKADALMVEVYHRNYKFINILADDYKRGNIHNCAEIYTLMEDGRLINSCPHEVNDNILEECLSCKYSKVCKPCKKQNVCTFFKRFFEVLNHGNESTVL